MSRRTERAAQAAAEQASIAARIEQQRPADEPSNLEPSTGAEASPMDPQDTEREPPRPRNEPRRLAMDEIAARHERTSGNTAVEPDPDVATDPPADPPKAEDPPEPAAATPIEPPAQPAAAPAAPAVEMVTVKIDGVESQVSKAEVDDFGGIRSYQAFKASENRLKTGNEQIAEARRMQAALAQAWQQIQQPKQPQQTDAEFMQSVTYAIRNGTEEEASAAISALQQRNRVDPQALEQQTMQKVLFTIEKKAALDMFTKEFQDICANPVLLGAAINLEANAPVQQGADLSTRFRDIGTRIRSEFGRHHQPATLAAAPSSTPDTTSQGDRAARKATIVNLPTAAAARAAPPVEDKPQSRADVLAEMQKIRGIKTG